MSTFDDAMATYKADLAKIGADYDEDLLRAVAEGLGPAIYSSDAKLVSCDDPEERKRIKDNFLVKKLGLPDGAALMDSVQAVCEQTSALKGNKHRAVFYYLLTKAHGKENVYAS